MNTLQYTVENETLVFDFSDGDNSHYAMSGKVKATYEMRNPTNETQSVQMAFPFVGRLDSLKAEDIVITTDGSVIPYEVYLGDAVNSYGGPLQEDNKTSFDFERIVSTLTDKAYQMESIGGKKTGEVGVSFSTIGTMDKTKTAEPLHSFEYILNPANNWSDFKNLNIKIITPPKNPFIVKSSVELNHGENNVYTANLAALPEDDLSFTLYVYEKITFLDRFEGSLKSYFGYFTPLLIGAMALLIMGLSIIRAGRRKRF